MNSLSALQQLRTKFQPQLPKILQEITSLVPQPRDLVIPHDPRLVALFPKTMAKPQPFLVFASDKAVKRAMKKVGVVFSGGQAPGGHNVICGLYDALKKLHLESRLYGFYHGPSGLIHNHYIELTAKILAPYRNQGGFDLIGSGRTKIETAEQYEAVETAVRGLDLDGLVIVGGDDSNTNAALLAEYFLKKGCKTTVVGVPKTIDGDLKDEDIEISFGFDTACKIYSEVIGNIQRDSLSAKKYYHFIKLMGRSASHVTLECALQTHPNIALISEEIEKEQKTFARVIQEICDVICLRSAQDKDYGVILIPEGIVEFIPEFKYMIGELNTLLSDSEYQKKLESLTNAEKCTFIATVLTKKSASCFKFLSNEIRWQLLMDRDPHGNVQVSKIEIERFFIEAVQKELKHRKKTGVYTGKFNGQANFCGYEGRSGLPSNFDAQYCYALGHAAALLVDVQATGYIACIQQLSQPVQEWTVGGKGLINMLTIENRQGKDKPVIHKALVDLRGKPFSTFKALREDWAIDDVYCCPGPIQFFGPKEITDSVPISLAYESHVAVS